MTERVHVSVDWTEGERTALRSAMQARVTELVNLILWTKKAPAEDLEVFRYEAFGAFVDRRVPGYELGGFDIHKIVAQAIGEFEEGTISHRPAGVDTEFATVPDVCSECQQSAFNHPTGEPTFSNYCPVFIPAGAES